MHRAVFRWNGKQSAKAQKTNVWRLFQAIDQRDSTLLPMYDDGVGTSSNKYLAALGGAFGFGLKRNVIDLYKFVCRNWNEGDKIYGFGFSRGAFTIRVLVGLIAREGLVPFTTEEELDRNARSAYRDFRSKAFPSWSPIVVGLRWLRDAILSAKNWIRGEPTYAQVSAQRRVARIRFLGLWDTVEAYGIPIAELKRGIDWVLWPMLFGDYTLSKLVDRACHALSLDDLRTTFHPLPWDEAAEAEMVKRNEVPAGRITQVWFAGVHSNVGGGYPEDRLSFVPLEWIMSEAKANELPLDDAHIRSTAAASSPYARLYDSRAGLAAYFRYGPRSIPKYDDHPEILPMVHGSVIMRMGRGSDQYAPIILPHQFWVVAPDGELLPMTAPDDTLSLDDTKTRMAMAAPATKSKEDVADEKAALQDVMANDLARPDSEAIGLVRDTVWWRRLFYALTVTLTAVVVAYPFTNGYLSKVVVKLVGLIPVVGKDIATQLTNGVGMGDVGAGGSYQPGGRRRQCLYSVLCHALDQGTADISDPVRLDRDCDLRVHVCQRNSSRENPRPGAARLARGSFAAIPAVDNRHGNRGTADAGDPFHHRVVAADRADCLRYAGRCGNRARCDRRNTRALSDLAAPGNEPAAQR